MSLMRGACGLGILEAVISKMLAAFFFFNVFRLSRTVVFPSPKPNISLSVLVCLQETDVN